MQQSLFKNLSQRNKKGWLKICMYTHVHCGVTVTKMQAPCVQQQSTDQLNMECFCQYSQVILKNNLEDQCTFIQWYAGQCLTTGSLPKILTRAVVDLCDINTPPCLTSSYRWDATEYRVGKRCAQLTLSRRSPRPAHH